MFARDLYEAFTGLLVAGDLRTARDATLFLFDRQQQADGSMPRNSLTNGKPAPDTGGLQLDETSYPILMAWQSGLAGNHSLYENHVVPAADFLVAHGPSDGVERWEEQSGDSPSTIAAEIAGLTAASHIAAVNGDPVRARLYQAVADQFARTVKALTVTDNGPFVSPTVPSYFIRIDQNGDPNSPGSVNLGNGSLTGVDQRSVIDAGFLDLVRLGVLSPNDPTVKSSLTVVDDILERSTPSGVGFYRYGINATESVDGYGDCYQPSGSSCTTPGAPWPPTDTGTGHLWPVLSGERGEYELAAADPSSARSLLQSMQNMQSGQGLEPEQAWEDPDLAASPYGTDPKTASIGFTDGQAAGSASPLTWAQAQYARLAIDLSAGRNVETPRIVTDRYVTHGMPGSLPVTISSPTPGANVTGATVTVSGTTAPGATVDAAAVGSAGGAAATATTTADSSGDWSLPVATSFGNTVITVTATQGGSTGYAQDNVNSFVLPGSQVFSVTDPTGDDNGPGTFQYPTASDFSPGAFDLTGVSVNQTSTDVYLTVSIKNLASTFGNAFGAQLLDVYVHDPSAPSTSTAAAFTTRNYTIAPADAWSERLELQGFASPDLGRFVGRLARLRADDRGSARRNGDAGIADVRVRHGRRRLGVHRRADRPERLQPRQRARLHPARGGLHVRRLPGREHRRDLLGGPEHDAGGDRHDHAHRRQPGDRAGPDARAGRALRRGSDESVSSSRSRGRRSQPGTFGRVGRPNVPRCMQWLSERPDSSHARLPDRTRGTCSPQRLLRHPRIRPRLHGHPRDSNAPYRHPRIRTHLHRHPRIRTDLHRHPRIRTHLHRHPRIRMHLHRHPRIRMHLHRHPRIRMHLDRHPRIRMHLDRHPGIRSHVLRGASERGRRRETDGGDGEDAAGAERARAAAEGALLHGYAPSWW